MSIVFKQGTHDYLQLKDGDLNDERILENAKDKIKELFNLKNVSFLFGSGTSCNAIPCMSGLHEEAIGRINAEGLSDYLKQYVYQDENLEDLLGILYSRKFYLVVPYQSHNPLIFIEEKSIKVCSCPQEVVSLWSENLQKT